jgi:hypothetical protein
MGCWSAQRNDNKKNDRLYYSSPTPQAVLRASQKKREHFSSSGGFSDYFGGFDPLHKWRCALRFKASAVAM